jgi:glycosyltransferase involved in cell wall biosynthesis
MADPTRVIGCTVVTRRELPAARVLAQSYLEHHPDHEFVVVVLDHVPVSTDGVRVVGPEWLACKDFARLATAYEAGDLAAAVVPHALRSALDKAAVAIYLAPTTHVLAPLSEVPQLAENQDIVLTPRLLEPLPLDGKQPDEVPGPFSLGFIAVGQGAREFLGFWARQSRHATPASEPQTKPRTHAVQRIPGLFRHTVLRDQGLDVGYWNLHERTAPRLVNLDGYNPRKPWLLSEHCQIRPRVLLSEHEAFRTLADNYRQALLSAGESEPDLEYGFDTLSDGTPLTASIRKCFRQEWAAAERDSLVPTANPTPLPPPFDDPKFRDWLRAPANQRQAAAGLTRIAAWVWSQRPDLQIAFRHPYLEDAEAFRNWCRDYGVAEQQLPEWALPWTPEPLEPPVSEFGVNLAGYLTGELGLGEMGRITHRVLEHAGIPTISVVEADSLTCRTALPEPDDTGRPRFPLSILAVNADYTRLMLETYPEIGQGRYRIGLWAWELEEFPEWQHDAFAMLDEVWTVSEFCRKAIAARSTVPVKVIPVPVVDPGAVSRPRTDTVRFLFAFDFNSTSGRKNPMGVLSAFQQAFPGRDDVRLVLKATNAELHAPAAEQLRLAVRGDRRVRLLERYLSVAELDELYTSSHAYVSLHRSEGFGLTVAEAMIRGLPVISTDYSGTAEFVDESVGWPIAHGMVEVEPGWEPYQAGAVWADPDLDQAARAMREIADNPTEANQRGKAAREHLLHTRSFDAAATWMRTELTAAYEAWLRLQLPPEGVPGRGSQLRSVARRGVNRLRRHTGR